MTFVLKAMDKELCELENTITKQYFTDPTQSRIDLTKEESFKHDDTNTYTWLWLASVCFSDIVKKKLEKHKITEEALLNNLFRLDFTDMNEFSKHSPELYKFVKRHLLNFHFFKNNFIDYIAFDIIPYKDPNRGGKIIIKDIEINEKKARQDRYLAMVIGGGLGFFLLGLFVKKLLLF